jgi:hypothetical protein
MASTTENRLWSPSGKGYPTRREQNARASMKLAEGADNLADGFEGMLLQHSL